MKTTRRKFLQGLGAAIAGLFAARGEQEHIAKIDRDFDDAIMNGVEGGVMPVGVLSAEHPELDADPYDPTYENDNFGELAMQVAADTGGILTIQGIDLEGNLVSGSIEFVERACSTFFDEDDTT